MLSQKIWFCVVAITYDELLHEREAALNPVDKVSASIIQLPQSRKESGPEKLTFAKVTKVARYRWNEQKMHLYVDSYQVERTARQIPEISGRAGLKVKSRE